MRKRSEKLKAQLKILKYWQNGLRHCLYKLADEFRDAEEVRKQMNEASSKVWECEETTDNVFAVKIGKAVVSEI